MNLLAIDSASKILSAAVSKGDEIFCTETDAEMRQSELVMGFIDNLTKQADLKPCDLNGVLCMGGPGSFTGLRIGYSIAKGLALSLSIPFAAVPTLDCIAYQKTINREQLTNNGEITNPSLQLAVIQARKNAFFYAFFRGGERITADGDADFEQIAGEIKRYGSYSGTACQEQILLSGPGSALLYESLPESLRKNIKLENETGGYAREIILLAKKRNMPDNENTAPLFSGPEYIRKTDAELNLNGKAGI